VSDAILVINAGSSSIKFSVFPGHQTPTRQGILCEGECEGIGHRVHFTAKDRNGASLLDETLTEGTTHEEALAALLQWLEVHFLNDQLVAAGHRVVHGGSLYTAPVLIDATYAGLMSGATDVPLVIPALNRDGDCLSDLVLPMFGSIAGAESVLLAFDEHYDTTVAMAEAPHGTAPVLHGKDLANPLAMILACGAVLRHASDRHGPDAERCSRAVYEAVLETIASGVKTPDLGGHAGTTEFTSAVVERIRTKIEVSSSLGSAA